MIKKQNGQAVVEFAFVVPIVVCLFLAIVYIGILFIDYTQYNNAARSAARDIAVIQTAGNRKNIIAEINRPNENRLKIYAVPLSNLYKATWKAEMLNSSGNAIAADSADATDIRVTINLGLSGISDNSFFKTWHVLPETLKVTYKMRLEKLGTPK